MKYLYKDTPLWMASRVMVSTRCEEMLACWTKAIKTFSPEDIHDLRVASRRLREALTLFTHCFPAKKFSRIKAETKQLTNLLGAIRNTDEALRFFTPLLSLLPEAVAPSLDIWLKVIRKRRSKEHRHLERRLRKLNLILLKHEVHAALDRPYLFVSAANDPFMPVNRYFAIKLLERGTSLQHHLPDSLCEENHIALHRLRIAFKKFRYAFEFTAPLIPEEYRDIHSSLKQYQELLGKIHDIDVFQELLREQKISPECFRHLAELLASSRRSLYAEYLTLNATHPVDRLGERARELL